MIFRTLQYIVTHPLNKSRRIAALGDWFRWQVGSRLLPGSVEVPFVNDSILMVESGMTGATGNIYAGLAEFEEMGFLLHFLNSDDLFVDIGANVGAFTVLASKAIGSRSIAIEALPMTHVKLMKNIRMNNILTRVDAPNCALGEKDGDINFTTGLDTMNHVATAMNGAEQNMCFVPIRRLDDLLQGKIPKLIKIDVEGYETPVIHGAMKTLQSLEQEAVIMELNGCGERYDFDDDMLHNLMLETGYIAVSYDPFTREIKCLSNHNRVGNTIYLKKSAFDCICQCVRTSSAFQVKGQSI